MHEQFKNDFPKFYQQLQSHKDALIEEILPGTTEAELLDLERNLGLPLPESYKRLLRCARGFWLRGGAIQFTSGHPFFHKFPALEELTPRQLQTVRAKGGVWPPPSQGMLCFAEFFMEADGDQVLFDVSEGLMNNEYPIMYYAHENNPTSVRKLADSFGQWMEEFMDYKEWG